MRYATIQKTAEVRRSTLILKSMQMKSGVLQKEKNHQLLTTQKDMIITADTPLQAIGITVKALIVTVLILIIPLAGILILNKITATPLMISILIMIMTIALILITKVILTMPTKMSTQATSTEWNILSEDHPVLLINHLAAQNNHLRVELSTEQAMQA